MQFNARCLVCDVAWELGLSEQKFYDKFDTPEEREQLIATYQSRLHRAFVQDAFPSKARK